MILTFRFAERLLKRSPGARRGNGVAWVALLASFAPFTSARADEKPTFRPSISNPAPLPGDRRVAPVLPALGGPIVNSKAKSQKPRTDALASTRPDNPLGGEIPPGTPVLPDVTYAGATEDKTSPLEPPKALGPAPYELGTIARLQVGLQNIDETPMRVGNLDILAPLVEEFPILGASVTRADPRNVPGNSLTPLDSSYFQINRSGAPPIVLSIGQSKAWIDKNEQTLRAAPLVIDKQIYLPVFSLAPLVGAATRLSENGTLVLTPTVQSVELFPYQKTIAVTVKLSKPIPAESFKVSTLNANGKPRIYVDFPGHSMGFDANNTTNERTVSEALGDVQRARVGMPQKFPDTTRVTLDLKRPMIAKIEAMPDPTLFAIVLSSPKDDTLPPFGKSTDYNPPLPTAKNPLAGLLIVVDPGHGDQDSGARGRQSNEKTHVLAIGQMLAKNLRELGANVQMTRSNDTFIPLQGRVDFANYRKADLFISVHANASVNKNSTGTETFYYTAQSVGLAREVHKEFVKATGCPNRGVAAARFFVIRKTWMPSILLETAFVSNAGEEAKLMSWAWRNRVAQGVAQGVVNYVRIYRQGALRG